MSKGAVYQLACVPNWVDHGSTTIVAGNEASGRPATNLQDPLMGKTWRTDHLRPSHMQLNVDYGQARPSSVVFLGNVVLPEEGSKALIQRSHSGIPFELIPYPNMVNTVNYYWAGHSAVSYPFEDPTQSTYAANQSSDGQIEQPLRRPSGYHSLPAGSWVIVRVMSRINSGGDHTTDFPSLRVSLLNGSGGGATVLGQGSKVGYSSAGWELFELPILLTASNSMSSLYVRLEGFTNGGAMPDLGSISARVCPSTGADRYEPTSFTNQVNVQNLATLQDRTDDPFRLPKSSQTTEAEPVLLDNAWSFRAKFDHVAPGTTKQPWADKLEANGHRVIIRYRAKTYPNTATITLTVYQDGVATSATALLTPPGTWDYWGHFDFATTALNDSDGDGLEIDVACTSPAGEEVYITALQLQMHTTGPHYPFDSGIVDAFPKPASTSGGLNTVSRGLMPKRMQRSLVAPFVDPSDPESIIEVTARNTFVWLQATIRPDNPELALSTMKETDYGLDVGRMAEGPGIAGVHLQRGNFGWRIVDPSRVEYAEGGGGPFVDEELSYLEMDVALTEVAEDDMIGELSQAAFEHVGLTSDVLVVAFPLDPELRAAFHAWGLLESIAGRHLFGEKYRAAFTVRERTPVGRCRSAAHNITRGATPDARTRLFPGSSRVYRGCRSGLLSSPAWRLSGWRIRR